MKMKKYLMFAMALLLISIPCVMAPVGVLRISPMWPVMVGPSYTFEVWSQDAATYDVRVLLVISQDCYDGMSDGNVVTVADTNSDTITKADFTANAVMLNSAEVPTGATNPYTVASLKDHLDYGGDTIEADDTIYWALSEIIFNSLTGTHVDLDVTLASTEPRMLVYLIGNNVDGSEAWDVRVPPTNPGFMVPEVVIGTIVTVAAMFGALGLFALKKKRISTK
jgi:hypothetical protein